MKWTREEYLALATGQNVGRQMITELFGPLIGLEEEWKRQGATQQEIDMTAFCWDYVPRRGIGGMGFIHTQPAKTLSETATHIITVDGIGRTMKLVKGYATIALPMDFPVKDMDSWLAVKHMLQFEEMRVNPEALIAAKKAQAEGELVTASIPGGYDVVRELMGDEEACVAFLLNPELINDILSTVTDTCVQVLSRVTDIVSIDVLGVHEDMAGKSGPLIGPDLIRKYINPYYKTCWEIARASGAQIFSQDSDGDMSPVVEAFLESGLTRFYPCEPVGGMDVVSLRKKHGANVMFKGGIDKHVLKQDKAAIRAELEYRMQPLMRSGGMVFALDHRIPNGTPLVNYRYYVDTAREILGREPVSDDTPGWLRMAF